MPKILVKKLSPEAVLPFQGSEDAAGWDLTALDVQFKAVQIPGAARQPQAWWVSTGLAMEIPKGYYLAIYARSGLGTESFLRPSNCVGIIDSDYRGEIKIRLIADAGGTLAKPKAGMVVAQCILRKKLSTEFVEVEELSETARAAGGFGSTTVPADEDQAAALAAAAADTPIETGSVNGTLVLDAPASESLITVNDTEADSAELPADDVTATSNETTTK